MTFSIRDNDTGGEQEDGLWNESQGVEVSECIYNVALGINTILPTNLHNYDHLFLQVDILHPTAGRFRRGKVKKLILKLPTEAPRGIFLTSGGIHLRPNLALQFFTNKSSNKFSK